MSADTAGTAAPRLHVLLTMWYLVHRSGAELFTRDLALWFRRRGHSVTVFAPVLGEMADELRHESIACITDPALLARRPDIIVGNTHNETVRAILQFPDVPAVSICHDRSHEHGRPPQLSQVRRYVAVDENCKERLCHEHGIAPERVEVIQNGVDLDRFAQRAPLPEHPQRALVFSSYAQDDALLAQIRAACAEAGMQLDVIGAGVDNLVHEPGALLGNYDLVFAKGRAATEALAVGCACILLDHSQHSMGFMVRSTNMESARRWNFGRSLLTRPISRENLAEAVAQYDPVDAVRVCEWIRTHAGLDAAGSAFEQLIVELIRKQPAIDVAPAQQVAELLRYMRNWIEAGQPTGEHLQIAQLREQVLRMHHDLNAHAEAAAQIASAHAQLDETRAQYEALLQQLRNCQDALDTPPERKQILSPSPAEAQALVAALHAQIGDTRTQNLSLLEQLRAANDALAAKWEHARILSASESALRQELEKERAEAAAAREQVAALQASASWRTTAPLRAGLDLIMKLLGRS